MDTTAATLESTTGINQVDQITKMTQVTLIKQIPYDNIFQDFTTMARSYDTLFQPLQHQEYIANDIIQINTQHETRFTNALIKLMGAAYEPICNILANYRNEIYMAGGLVNLALDPLINIDNPVFDKSDIDLFILADHEKRRLIVGTILYQLMDLENGDQTVVGANGSVVYIWHPSFNRMIQLVLMDTQGYPNIDTVIKGFDIDNIALAYNGQELIVQKRAWQAIRYRVTKYRPLTGNRENKIYRLTKTACKGYTIQSVVDDHDITPTLEHIIGNDKARDYLCTPYMTHTEVLAKYRYDKLQIIQHYMAYTTAVHVYFLTTYEKLFPVLYSAVNFDGIRNMDEPGQYHAYIAEDN